MLIICSTMELGEAQLTPLLHNLAASHLQRIIEGNPRYEPDNDGYLAIITSTDSDASLGQQLGRRWQDSLFEGVSYDDRHRCFVTVILRNNQFAVTILIPDESWLDPLIRQRLILELDDQHPTAPLPKR